MRGCGLARRWLRASPFVHSLRTLTLLLVLIPCQAGCPPCPASCPPPPAVCTQGSHTVCGECLYKINNSKKSIIVGTSVQGFELECQNNEVLGDPSFPVLNELTPKIVVVLKYCGVPNEPYVQVLAKLNVTVYDYLSIIVVPTPTTRLRDDHFKGLDKIRTLIVESSDIRKSKIKADSGLLKPLQSVETLHLFGVLIPPEALKTPPPLVTELKLHQCELNELPRVTFSLLPRLQKLIVIDEKLQVAPDVRNASKSLTYFTLEAPRVANAILSSSIVNFTFNSISNLRWEGGCDSLQNLIVHNVMTSVLPERWVADCPKLTGITLFLTNLTNIPDNALENAKPLQRFQLTNSPKLTTLPAGLFRDTTNLSKLILSHNNLTTLPGIIFSYLKNIKEIDVEDNSLGSISNYPVHIFEDMTSLEVLNLNRNPLGDLCANDASIILSKRNSPLHKLTQLTSLKLSQTGAKRICPDWKDYMKFLEELDLSENDIEKLVLADLYWSRDESLKEAEVYLEGNPIVYIELQPEEVHALRSGHKPETNVKLYTDSTPTCDCRLYWFAKAFTEEWLPVTFANEPECKRSRYSVPLRSLDLRKMTCSVVDTCPKNCTCELRAYDGTTAVSCQNLGLKSIPKLEHLMGKLELNMTGNELTSLTNIPENVVKLDIRRNNITEFSKVVDEKLTQTTGSLKVWLAGNPLACRCADPLLRHLAVRNGSNVIQDVEQATCANGNTLVNALHDACWVMKAAVWSTLGAALALALTGAVFIVLKRAVRLRLKAYLLARGLCVRWVKPDDNDDCKYDAFLSFSHLDTDYAEQILQELESGPKRFKLCVHYRDWPVGIWIPAQIARSVTESRRTIILLSENYVGSSWARAEFREAYAKAVLGTSVRLIVVILGDKPPKGLDDELQHYVDNNTYVKWGEPAFWEKLRRALPEPRHVSKPQNHHKYSKSKPDKSQKPRKRRKSRKKKTTSQNVDGSQNGDVNMIPQIVVVPNSPNAPAVPSPPTPIVKFSQMDFPTPVKPPKQEAAACA